MSASNRHYTVFGTEEELKLSHRLAQSVGLEDVFLTSCSGQFLGQASERLDGRSYQFGIRVNDGVVREHNPGLLAVDFKATMEVFLTTSPDPTPDQDAPPPEAQLWLTLTLVATAVYSLPPGDVPESIGEAGIKAFARLNGAYHCWPFLREQFERMAWHMGRVHVVLPLLFVKPKAEPEQQEPSEDTP